jgi:PIN domain nuclease of toxin-antitoxin system
VSRVVLDASAILALLNEEPGAEKITLELLSQATTSTVNLAEVQAKLVREGGDPEEVWALIMDSLPHVEPFTAEQAKIEAAWFKKRAPSASLRRSSLPGIGDRSEGARLHDRSAMEEA